MANFIKVCLFVYLFVVSMNAQRGWRESPHYKAQDWSELYGRVHKEEWPYLMPRSMLHLYLETHFVDRTRHALREVQGQPAK